jgi:glycosyltransferase involved in cell wall biosynthesis
VTPVRVLYSFPHKIGAGRICETAWHQVAGVDGAGGEVTAFPGAVARPLPATVRVRPTLSRGRFRIPYRALGVWRALSLHDRIVARRLPSLAGKIDVVHTWPSGALETLRVARRLGVPTVLERPSAHTRTAYELVKAESERLEVPLPPLREHAFEPDALAREEEEFELADRLLCPSEFVVRSFVDQGFAPEKLLRHSYGFDDSRFRPAADPPDDAAPYTVLFAAHASAGKGLHYALEAWGRSPASGRGRLLVAGEIQPAYEEKLTPLLLQPGVERLGFRTDIADLMRTSHALVLPSVQEGFPLVVLEAMASGCVPLVSDVCAGVCVHGRNALVHEVGDVDALVDHITALDSDRELRRTLRKGALADASGYTWDAAGRQLLGLYESVARD